MYLSENSREGDFTNFRTGSKYYIADFLELQE